MQLETMEIGNTMNTFTAGSDYNISSIPLTGGTYYYNWWPSTWTVERDKTATAMKIVRALMDKRLVDLKSIKQFVTLVDEIGGLL